MRSRAKWLVVLVGMAVIAAACGGDESTTEPPQVTQPPETQPPAAELQTDVGVDDTTIKVGLLADQTGAFSPLVIPIVESQQAYWQKRNAEGGIAGGRMVELVVRDTAYDPANHVQLYEELKDEVVFFSQSTGSPHTMAIRQQLESDQIGAIPLTFYSGWPDPTIGANLFEHSSNYCLEAFNILSFAKDNGAETIAIATWPGDYGEDGGTGAKMAAETLGLEVVYDGVGAQPVGGDPAPEVVAGIVGSNPDWVFLTMNPSGTAGIIGASAQQGFQGAWTGSGPSYNPALLGTPIGPILAASYFASGYYEPYGADVAGMQEISDALKAYNPELTVQDTLVLGWMEGIMTEMILEAAFASGDMTQAGVLAAGQAIPEIDFGDLAPKQTYAGTPNEYVVRASSINKPNLETFTAQGGLGTVGDDPATTSDPLTGFFVAEATAAFDYTGACFTFG